MSTKEIISGIIKLPYKDRIKVIEVAVKSLETSDDERLERAAKSLYKDYKSDKKLTTFTSLDIDNFYEAR